MQNSNLSSKIFPNSKESWSLFISKVENDLQDMMVTYNNDKRRIRDLARIINKLTEIRNISKSNYKEILNYRELFMYIDNSLESSFDALNFFKKQDNFDNPAVKTIYERIINSPKMIEINSEYSSLSIKVQFDKERIKRLSELIRGSKVDYLLIEELVNRYNFKDKEKNDVMLYALVMLSIRQNDIKTSKDNKDIQKQEKEKFYHDRFNELCKKYQKMKENYKLLLLKCFNVREKIDHRELDMYNSFINNPEEIDDYDFTDEIKFKIYTLAFFKIKKDIEDFIDGISDLEIGESDLDDELVFFNEMINEFESNANKLKLLIKDEKNNDYKIDNNVFFALDAFNRLIIKDELLKNKSSIRALLQKIDNNYNSKIEGVKTNHMLGVVEEEEMLGRNISMLTTSKMKLAYVMVGKSVLIIAGDYVNADRFDKVVKLAINRNIVPIRKQISQIEGNDLTYIELQNKILNNIIQEEDMDIQKAM